MIETQLQQGLKVITEMAKKVNAKSVELSNASEELNSIHETVSKLRQESDMLNQNLIICHGNISVAEAIIKLKNDEVSRLRKEEQELSLNKAVSLNEVSATQNSAIELKKIKEFTKEELAYFRTLKDQNIQEYLKSNDELLALKTSLITVNKELNDAFILKLEAEKELQDRYFALDTKESQLIEKEKQLNFQETRLENYRKELNLN